MTLRELKVAINGLSDDMLDYICVNGEYGLLEKDEVVYRVDNPISAIYVEKVTKEICFFHQTQEDIKDMKIDGIT